MMGDASILHNNYLGLPFWNDLVLRLAFGQHGTGLVAFLSA